MDKVLRITENASVRTPRSDFIDNTVNKVLNFAPLDELYNCYVPIDQLHN